VERGNVSAGTGAAELKSNNTQEKGKTMKLIGMALLFVGVSSFAFAIYQVPEVNAGSAGSALALLSGALLMIRGRKK
jgi:cell division septal protein FtsQ